MEYKDYAELNSVVLDVLKEIGSIGSGHAATALSSALSAKITMTVPEVNIMGYDQAIASLGGPEKIIVAVLVNMSGEVRGTLLYLMDLDLLQVILEKYGMKPVATYADIDEMSASAATEIANIIISSYTNALSELSGVAIQLSVPSMALNMLGGIMSVPMTEYGYTTDSIMMVEGKFKHNNREIYSNLIMLPEMESLNFLLHKLGVDYNG